MILLLLVALLIASAGSMVGWALANTLADPLDALTRAAGELSKGELDVRVKPAGAAELRRLAETFNTMAARLQSYTEELRAFVANASHELRTPLTVVKLRTEALRDGALEDPKVATQFVADIDNEVDRLVRMVNDLLDLSRIEAGLVSGQRQPINLGLIASDVHETFSIRAGREDVHLDLDVEPDLPLVLGNEDQLRRVLDNLIENAIKYTQSGDKIELTLRGGSNGQTVRILVKDNGPGIAPDNLPHIFERFYRVESTRPRTLQPRGSGLGLAIAKSLIESHGGKIGASSQLGKGSTFWVELPALPPHDDAA
jgi:signal transduction histidine kinase